MARRRMRSLLILFGLLVMPGSAALAQAPVPTPTPTPTPSPTPLQIVPPVRDVVWYGAQRPMVPLQVTMGIQPGDRLQILSAGAQDTTTYRTIGGPFLLCLRNDPQSCKTIVRIDGAGPRQLWLHPGGSSPPSGVYTGSLTLTANGAMPGQTFPMTFNVTTDDAYRIGGALLLCGTILGLLLTYGVPAYRNLLQAERPAAVLRTRLAGIVDELATAKQRGTDPSLSWPLLDAALGEVDTALQPATLAAYRAGLGSGSPWPIILSQIAAPVDTAALVTHVTEQGERLARLAVLAHDGIVTTMADTHDIVTRPMKIATLDRLAIRRDIPDAQAMLDAIHAALRANGVASLIAAGPAAARSWTHERIDVATARLSLLWLGIAALLTFVTGFYVLALGKPGFGRVEDYLYCLLWGLGFATGAGTLPSLTAETIRGQVGLVKA